MRTRRLAKLLYYLVLVIVACFALFPFFWVVGTSLKTDIEVVSVPPVLLPIPPWFGQYMSMLTTTEFVRYLQNSAITSVGATAICLLLGVPAAYGFARFHYRLDQVAFGGIIAARMLPTVLLTIPYFFVMQSLGLMNTTAGLIIVYVPVALPLMIWILEGFFRTIPHEIEEAAEVDGLGTLGILIRIVVPLSLPALAVATLFGFLQAWNEFVLALTISRTADSTTVPVGLASFITTFQTFYGQMTAAATVYAAPGILVALVLHRGLVRGLVAGATR